MTDRQIPRQREPPNNHKHILSLARRSGGILHPANLERELRRKITVRTHGKEWERLLRQQLDWNRTAIEKLVEQGVLIPQAQDAYRVNEAVLEIGRRKSSPPFRFGENHRKLLSLGLEGVLDMRTVYGRLGEQHKNPAVFDRQWKLHKGMVKNLAANGYLAPAGRDLWQLTEQALEAVRTPQPHKPRKPVEQEDIPRLQITAFDAAFLDISREGRFLREDISRHPRRASLSKRLKTLTRHGLIHQYAGTFQVSEELRERIEAAQARSRGMDYDIEILVPQQRELARDLYRFSQLSRRQINTYLLADERFAAQDRDYLLRKKIVCKIPAQEVYTLTPRGQELAKQVIPEGVKFYRTKALHRPTEIAHDLLVYNAYKDMELKLEKEGCVITGFKTDRDLRSDYNAQQLRDYRLPDLQMYYRDREGLERTADVEIDMGKYTSAIYATQSIMGVMKSVKG